MSLKRQLFIASLLMLLIPWAGLQFVLELDAALRQQASDQLNSQANRLVDQIETALPTTAVNRDDEFVVYAPRQNPAVYLDGYGTEWTGYNEETGEQPWQGVSSLPDDATLKWRVAVLGEELYLFLQVNGRDHSYVNPANPDQPFDFLRVYFAQADGVIERIVPREERMTLNGRVPGSDGELDRMVRGHWETAAGKGHQLELKMPRPPYGGSFGFKFIGATGDTPNPHLLFELPESHLIARDADIETIAGRLIAPGQSLWLLEQGGWVMARRSEQPEQTDPDFQSLTPNEILERIVLNGLRALVQAYQPDPVPLDSEAMALDLDTLPEQGLVEHSDGGVYLLTQKSLPNERTLLLEESLDQMLTLSGSTLGAVIARSLLLLVGLMLVLLGYASWLSWRITRLQKAVSNSIDEDGRLLAPLPPAKARDELGDLSRQFSHLTERLHGYTHYLESFSRRLSHELKTPVAVVRSSLENLSQSQDETERANYVARAKSATDRLSQILHGMSEATRLEQSLDHAEKEPFDMADVCAQATAAYQTLAPDFQIQYRGPHRNVPYHGSPELLVQLLDKLVDNARDFTPKGGRIEVRLLAETKFINLNVFNEGSSLPEHLAADIFSPFVSVRSGKQEGHLGQGLLIARLIAEYHGGQIHAQNEQNGVRFTVTLPHPRPAS